LQDSAKKIGQKEPRYGESRTAHVTTNLEWPAVMSEIFCEGIAVLCW